MKNKRTKGFWFVIISGILLLLLLLLGQTMSFINYEFTVSLGLQEPVDEISKLGVAVNKAFGVGDTIIYVPILIAGLIGLWRKAEWSVFLMGGAFAITAYWPIVCLFVILFGNKLSDFNYVDLTSIIIVLISFTVYGIWGMWYVYKNQKLLLNR